MNRTRMTIVTAAALFTVAAPLLAQDGPPAPGDRQRPAANRARWQQPDLPRETVEQIRTEADKNGDGQLDDAERQAAREMIRMKAEEREMKLLAEFDADGDGQLNAEEREAARAAEMAADAERREQRWAELFDEVDTNQDGQISREEWLAAREEVGGVGADDAAAARRAELEAQMAERRAELMKQIDTDGDGVISDAERRAIRDRFRQPGNRGQAAPGRPGGNRPAPPPADEGGLPDGDGQL